MASDSSASLEPHLHALPPLRPPKLLEDPEDDEASSWSSGFHARSRSTTPRSRSASPCPSPPPSCLRPARFSSDDRSSGSLPSWRTWASGIKLWGERGGRERWARQRQLGRSKKEWRRRRTRSFLAWAAVVAFFFLVNWWMFSRLQDAGQRRRELRTGNGTSASPSKAFSLPKSLAEWNSYEKVKEPGRIMFTRLLALAAHALAEAVDKPEPKDLWREDMISASSWMPCADKRNWETCEGTNGYILVSANGGINQQRVAICNAVAVARLLNSTLIVPKFLYSSVWRDTSDIYQEDHFINYLRGDIQIMKELSVELQSLDLEAIGSVVTDDDIGKESKPSFYMKKILPIILKNRVVHFVGFGNRLAFDPVPFELQRLRCRCNFHALLFVKEIQETGALLVKRMRHHTSHWGPLEHNLLGPFAVTPDIGEKKDPPANNHKYLAVHLRFEIDMAAYSLCCFGGGKEEEEELEAYREVHFPALTQLKKTTKLPSAAYLRSEGKCPLTPEEAVLMLAALGFNRKTSMYVAGAHIYGGKSRMAALANLYPNLATKESLLSASEIEPFLNFSSQLAALDFIVSAAADVFAMTDSGSQLSSLVSGYRTYYGGGELPTIRPNKRRLASIFSKNSTIEWKEFEKRVRKAVRQSKKVLERPVARSVYRHPRCEECMCKIQ